MAKLDSIDLTQGKRFEKILDEKRYKSLSVDTNSRGIHRLKKGEIPHFSLSNISIDTTTSDWIITTTPTLVEPTLSDNTLSDINISWTDNSSTNFSITYNNMTSWITTVDNAIEINSNLATNSYRHINNITSTSYYYKNTVDNDLSDKSINDRIKIDPFDTENFNYERFNGILYRIRESLSKKISQEKSNIHNRLRNYDNNINNGWRSMSHTRSILSRLYDNDDIPSNYPYIVNFEDYQKKDDFISNLKRKAPFIKRVYVTNRGHSFDSTELRFDMVLAKEHFEEAVRNMLS